MRQLLLIVVFLLSTACRDDLRVKTVSRIKDTIIPDVSSTVEVNADPSGTFQGTAREGAAQYGARILDASCNAMKHDLGIQTSPEFSLPADAYFQEICVETSYYDRFGKVIEVKLQPVTVKGPEAISLIMSQDTQILDFPDVPEAASYAYIVMDASGAIKLSASNLTDSYIDFKGALGTGDYKMILLAQNVEGKNIKAITYSVKVVSSGPLTSTNLNLKFERQYYQTRSIKRLLIDASVLDQADSLNIAGFDITVSKIAFYTGGFGALLDSTDAFMRSVLPYNGSTVSVSLPGLTPEAAEVPLTVKDFTIFAPLNLSFADGSYAKNGLEAWSSPLQVNTLKSGDHELTSTFGLMIMQ